MKLYICGNGFDQHHKLPTSYWDYKEFLEEYHPHIFKEYDNFPHLNESTKQSRWSDIESALCIDYEDLFDQAIQYYYPDLSSESDSRWYDLEIDIDSLTRFINDFTGRCFFEWLMKVEHMEAIPDLEFGKESIFINFNYTSTLQRLYNISETAILHIHGSLKNIHGGNVLWHDVLPTTSNIEVAEALGPIVEGDKWSNDYIREEIQFGATGITAQEVETELSKIYKDDDFYDVSIKPAIDRLVEFVDKSTKFVTDNYSKLSAFLDKHLIDEVIVMGVSFGAADDSYYSDILVPKLKNVRWTFMQYGESSFAIDAFIGRHGIKNYHICRW